MNNASPGYRLFEPMQTGGPPRKQQVTTLRLEHVSAGLSWRSCSISHSSPWQKHERARFYAYGRKALLVVLILSQVVFFGSKAIFLSKISMDQKNFQKIGATRVMRTCSVCSPVYRFVLFLEYFVYFHFTLSMRFCSFSLICYICFPFATYFCFFLSCLIFSCVFYILCAFLLVS